MLILLNKFFSSGFCYGRKKIIKETKKVDAVKELNKIVKMLVRRDFELMQLKEEREAKIQELKKTRKELEEAKTVLGVRVRAETRELQELAQILEEKVKQRTKELRENMQDLERFNKLAVGRELKMIALKKEIKGLREKLKNRETEGAGENTLITKNRK